MLVVARKDKVMQVIDKVGLGGESSCWSKLVGLILTDVGSDSVGVA